MTYEIKLKLLHLFYIKEYSSAYLKKERVLSNFWENLKQMEQKTGMHRCITHLGRIKLLLKLISKNYHLKTYRISKLDMNLSSTNMYLRPALNDPMHLSRWAGTCSGHTQLWPCHCWSPGLPCLHKSALRSANKWMLPRVSADF